MNREALVELDARASSCEAESRGEFSFTVKRNCSMSPRALLGFLAAAALVSLGIGVAFALLGLWMVLPFAGLEIVALAAALYIDSRHAADYERIALHDGVLMVELRDAERVVTHRFNPHWVRLVVRAAAKDVRIALAAHGKEVEVGKHLAGEARRLFADDLRARLRASARGMQRVARGHPSQAHGAWLQRGWNDF